MLGDQNTSCNGTMSSIALLQERFRQLQKMKEMRQEKEFIRFLSESSDRYSPPAAVTPTPTPLYNNMMLPPPRPLVGSQVLFVSAADHPELTLSLWPAGSQMIKRQRTTCPKPNHHHHHQSAFNLRTSWFADAPAAGLACGSMMKHERCDTDIDTSLHL